MNYKRTSKHIGLTRRELLKGGTAAFLLTGIGLVGCNTRPPKTPSIEEVSLRILWTGDSHGQLRPIYHREYYDATFLDKNGIKKDSPEAYVSSQVNFLDLAKQYGKVGGYAHLATLINQERSAYPDRTLLLDSGDAWYGSAIALMTDGQANVDVMNAMGYDAMTLHWEFNLGKETLLQRIAESNFAVLAQNLVDTDFEDRILEPSLVREMNGLRVAVVGEAYPFSLLTTEDRDANPEMRMGYRDLELQAEIDRLRQEEGVDILILLSHMGYEQDRAIAERLNGVDVIVGGHSHDILWQPEQVGQTLILQGGSHGKFLGKLDLEVRDGKISGYEHQLLPVIAEQIEPDSGINELINNLYAPFEDEFKREIGEAGSVLYRRSLFGGTTDAFMTAAYKEIVTADIGCASGWRFGTTILPGPITFEDVYNAMKPTPSPLYKASLSGRTIVEIMEDNLDNVFNPDPLLKLGGDVTRCSGPKVDLTRNAPREQRTSNIMINGEPMDRERVYAIATSGGRTQYRDTEATATSRSAVEELIEYIQMASEPITAEPVQAYTDIS
jgi:S-sulfosulfanyl-L-cysteine sulfohydrolase